MKIPFNTKWQLLEKEDYANYLFVEMAWVGFTWYLGKYGFIPGRFMGAEYIDSACNLFVEKSNCDKANKVYFQMLFTKPRVWDKLHSMTSENADKLFAFGKKIQKLNPIFLTDNKLVALIDKFQEAQMLVHVPRGPMFMLETPNNIVSNYLLGYLKEKYNLVKKPSLHPNEAFQVLTTPLKKSIWAREREELAKIILLKNKKGQEKLLRLHTKKYEWLEYGLQGKFLTYDHFAQEIKKISKQEAKKILDFKSHIGQIRRKQSQLFKEYKIHPVHQKIFQIVQDSLFTRLYSKDSQYFGYYSMEKILREFGRRTNLTLEQVRFLAYDDFKKALMQGKDFSKPTNERMKYSLFICDKNKVEFFSGQKARAIRAKLSFHKEKRDSLNAEELRGQPAFQGYAKGRVKIINTIPEMTKMHQGNILVSHMTNPGIVPAMKLAAGIVTDLGGITCHAAIVARELKKPCVIGTKFATETLNDGDLVEVDAERGIVRKL